MRINLKAKGENQKLVLAYLEENASDILVEKINSGKKTLDGCWNFVVSQAKKKAREQSSICCTDQEVFGWAVHYFEEDSIKEDEKKVIANRITQSSIEQVVRKEKKEAPKKEPKKEEKKDEQLSGQITLFDFVGGNV